MDQSSAAQFIRIAGRQVSACTSILRLASDFMVTMFPYHYLAEKSSGGYAHGPPAHRFAPALIKKKQAHLAPMMPGAAIPGA
jgi:hypothetical protein